MNKRNVGVHKAHCFQGEYINSCKYGEDNTCPNKINMGHTDTIIQLASRENQLYGLTASGKIMLLKASYVLTQGSNKPVVDEDGNKLLTYEWVEIIDSPKTI